MSMTHRREDVRLLVLSTVGVLVTILGFEALGVFALAQPNTLTGAEGGGPGSLSAMEEIRNAVLRLPLAAILGTALALRPRRHGQAARTVTVIQTQIMLAVVGAVIMIIVEGSLARAFGIVGIIGLVRFRSNTDDPKDAVVMLCTLCAGLACGVGQYILAPFATFFMAGVLWIVEYFEPDARKHFVLTISTKHAPEFRPTVEGLLHGLHLEYELLTQNDEEISYSVSAPLDVRTRDISDMFHILTTNKMEVEWKEKKRK